MPSVEHMTGIIQHVFPGMVLYAMHILDNI